jgi:tetratricopeptide (TPR) repeat protein
LNGDFSMVKKKITEAVTSNDPKTKRWRMMFAAGRMAYDTGDFHQAESLLVRAAEVAKEMKESSFGLNATEIGLAAVMLATKRSPEAAKRLGRIIGTLEGIPDPEHKELMAVALRFYSQALSNNGDERSAEKELKKSIDILEKLGPEASVQLAYSLCDLSGLYLTQGRLTEAEVPIMRAMKILSSVLGPESPEYTRADMIYQVCLPMQGDTRLEVVSDGIRKMEYLLGDKHPNFVHALSRYFKVLRDRGEKAKLEEAQEKFGVTLSGK